MSQEAAAADLQAAAYWRGVARVDRAEVGVAVSKVGELISAARREEKEPGEALIRRKRLSPG
jgi:hypothetical protein